MTTGSTNQPFNKYVDEEWQEGTSRYHASDAYLAKTNQDKEMSDSDSNQ